jgi:hypothetical protein
VIQNGALEREITYSAIVFCVGFGYGDIVDELRFPHKDFLGIDLFFLFIDYTSY